MKSPVAITVFVLLFAVVYVNVVIRTYPAVPVSKPPQRRIDPTPPRRLQRMPAVWSVAHHTEWNTPPVELMGQVTMQTTFGMELHRIARLPDVHLALEIGTWYGGGSSWCIAHGLRESMADPAHPDKWLITLELFDQAWQYAKRTLERMPVTCLKAGTVGMEGYLTPAEMTEAERASEHYILYYERDIQLANRTRPVLRELCETYDFDFVLIDGNEYTGLAEFEIVDSVCRPKYLALHDTGTLKTRAVEEILERDKSRWSNLSAGSDAVGWSVYKQNRY